MLTAFTVAATVSFLFLFVIWNGRDDRFNLMIKVAFAVLTMWGFACTLMQCGFHK